MPVKRRKPKARITGFPDWQIIFLETGALPAPGELDINEFELLDWESAGWKEGCPASNAWTACRDLIMADWTDKHPGTRPHAWWLFDSGLEPKRHPRGWNLSLAESIPDDQRAWLKEHGHLQPGG